MTVGNMHQTGYTSHGMTGRHDSVTSICLACHVYTSSCHTSNEMFSTAGFSASGRFQMRIVIQSDVPFVNGRARQAPLFHIRREHLHTLSCPLAQYWSTRSQDRSLSVLLSAWKKKIHSLLQLSLWPSSWASSTINLSMGLPTKEVCFVHTDQHDPWLVTTTWSREWDWCNKYSLKSFWSSTSPTSNVKTISWPGYITI